MAPPLDVAMGFSPAEAYSIEVEGDVVQHVTQLVGDGDPLCGCVLCRRFAAALATARYIGPSAERESVE